MKRLTRYVFLATVAMGVSLAAAAEKSATGATVYFVSPSDNATVASPFVVRFGLRGMGVAPAGVDVPGTGHHHLLINADPLPDLTQALPSSDAVRHFGKGQTETVLTLEPGSYTLQLVLGNHLHVPHDPPVMSAPIHITVE